MQFGIARMFFELARESLEYVWDTTDVDVAMPLLGFYSFNLIFSSNRKEALERGSYYFTQV